MRQILLLASCFFITQLAMAQCEPIFDFGDEPFGIEPDTIAGLMDGEVDVLYVQQIDVKVPADGSFLDLPFILVDSASISQIIGMPPGLSIECNGDAWGDCTYLGGSTGCAVISGIPESGGTFDLTIMLEVHTNGLGSVPFAFEGYSINIEGPVGVEETLAIQSLKIGPNPASNNVRLMASTLKSGEGTLRVMDLVGKEIYQQTVRLAAGSNQVDFSASSFPEGVYIVRFDAFGESQSRRMVVVH